MYSRIFYIGIKNWLKEANLKLPELSLENIILGRSENVMEDFLLLLYKYLLFLTKCKGELPNIKKYQFKLLEYEKLEYRIAEKSSKLHFHLEKYENLRDLMRDLNSPNFNL